MFLSEKNLKEAFWNNYNYNNRAIKYQFESEIREGGADLLTIERFQGNIQINAFEFKLTDIKKVIEQAKANMPYVNKSWIVVPAEKKYVIMDKYLCHIKELQYIGVMIVKDSGAWEVLHQPKIQNEISFNQATLNLMMKGY